jgi:hypothetical protein
MPPNCMRAVHILWKIEKCEWCYYTPSPSRLNDMSDRLAVGVLSAPTLQQMGRSHQPAKPPRSGLKGFVHLCSIG